MIFMASIKNREAMAFSDVKGKFLASSSQIFSNHFKGIEDSKELSRAENMNKKNYICLFFNLTRICLT